MGKFKIGVDLGGTNISAAILDEQNNIVLKDKRKTLQDRGAIAVIDDIAGLVLELCEKVSVDIKEIGRVGIGCPGAIDDKNGVVLFAGNLKGFDNLPIAALLKERLSIEVFVSNDANCAALGEFVAGAAIEYDSALLITIGTGIGGGFVEDGIIYTGSGLGGAEFGHITIVSGGEACTCGKKGCFECYCSATALIREAKKAALANTSSTLYKLYKENNEKMNGRIPFNAYKMGDPVAQKLIEDFIFYMGDGIVSIVNIMRPEVVMLSGGISAEGEILTVPLTEYLKKFAFAHDQIEPPCVATAKLGNDAGIVGAANL